MNKYIVLLLQIIFVSHLSFSQNFTNTTKLEKQKFINSKSSQIKNCPDNPKNINLKNRAEIFNEDFEIWPLTDWTIESTNSSYTWTEFSNGGNPGSAINVEYDPALVPQNELLISPAITLPDTACTLTFDFFNSVYWHVEPNNNVDITFKISLDSGQTWGNVIWQEDNEQLCEDAFCWPYDNFEWKTAYFNLEQYAGETIWLGFNYVGSDGAQFALDNVIVYETPSHNIFQTDIIPGFFYTNFGSFTEIPDEHLMDVIESNGIMFVSEVQNMGSFIEHVSLKVDVVHNGDTVYSHIGDTLELFPFTKDSVGFLDPAFFPGELEDNLGEFTMHYEVIIDSTDYDISDNKLELSFNVTDSIYARDSNPVDTSGAMTGWYGDHNGVSDDGDRWALYYYIANPGNPEDTRTAVFSLSVYVHDDTEAGSTVIAKIWDGETEGRPMLISSQEHIITEEEIGGWIEIPFEMNGGDEFLDQGIILAGVEIYGTAEFWIGSDNTIPHYNHTAYIYHASDLEWFYITDDLPMIRLNFGYPTINPGSVQSMTTSGLTLKQNSPNPCDSETEISFNLDKPGELKFSIFDITGKTIYSQEPKLYNTGLCKLKINTSEIESGTYFYQMEFDGVAVNRMMIINH